MVSDISSLRPQDLDNRDRNKLFARAENEHFDVLVIGGGITGAGVARSAASRGLSVVLVEAQDLASGTSSRSSKMIHGGVRYLAQGDVGLVRDAARERQVLREIAPHLTRKTGFLLPTRSAAGLAKFRTAMWTFEKIGKVPKEDHHEVWDFDDLIEREPLAATDGTTGAVRYIEFVTDDSRLTLANARSAASDGALILTYAPAVEFIFENEVVTGVKVRSSLEGESLETIIRAKAIVNAAGPWVDSVRSLEDPNEPNYLSITKGVHLVLPHERLPLNDTILLTAIDKRSIFAVPRGNTTYLGTTDTFYPEADWWPGVTEEDVDYLLESTNRSFLCEPIKPSDIVTSWSGVRPLISEPGKDPSEISRRDEIWTGPGKVLTIAGGKLTAYRSMAERVVDEAADLHDLSVQKSNTKEQPLIGGDVVVDERNHLIDLYGSEAKDVLADGGGVSAEVRQAVTREGAICLEDYWVRRVPRAFFDLDGGISVLQEAANEMGDLLSWDEEKKKKEIASCEERHNIENGLFASHGETNA